MFTKVCSFCVMLFETSHISIPYNNTAFTLDLNILSFVRLVICGLDHIARKRPNTAVALCSLLVIVQPR